MRVVDKVFPRRANGSADSSPNGAGPTAAEQASEAELAKRRAELADQLAELQFDLGGLAYEMAIRDHYRLDTITRVAARLQNLDAELGEVERLLRMERSGASGTCAKCGALHSHGAVFCWQCGSELMERQPAKA